MSTFVLFRVDAIETKGRDRPPRRNPVALPATHGRPCEGLSGGGGARAGARPPPGTPPPPRRPPRAPTHGKRPDRRARAARARVPGAGRQPPVPERRVDGRAPRARAPRGGAAATS